MMRHDCIHCNGDGCMLRETCMCYKAHLEYQADEGLKAVLSVPYIESGECLTKDYGLFWRTGCNGDGCAMRITCMRYLAWLQFGSNRPGVPMIESRDCISTGHGNYWPLPAEAEEGGER